MREGASSDFRQLPEWQSDSHLSTDLRALRNPISKEGRKAGKMVKLRMNTADVAAEVRCLRRLIGMRCANVYDLTPKVISVPVQMEWHYLSYSLLRSCSNFEIGQVCLQENSNIFRLVTTTFDLLVIIEIVRSYIACEQVEV